MCADRARTGGAPRQIEQHPKGRPSGPRTTAPRRRAGPVDPSYPCGRARRSAAQTAAARVVARPGPRRPRRGRNAAGVRRHCVVTHRDRSLVSHERQMNAHLPPRAVPIWESRTRLSVSRLWLYGSMRCSSGRQTRRDARHDARRSCRAGSARANFFRMDACHVYTRHGGETRTRRLLRRGHEPSLIEQRAGTALECVHQERAA